MERIRMAVQKAKERRAAAGPRTPVEPNYTGPAGLRRSDVDAAWEALPTFEPDPRHLNRNRIVAFEQQNAATVAFDKMRTKIIVGLRSEGWTRVGITSPLPKCGKTLVSVNLAFSFARHPDSRAVLLDMDLRRPQMANMMGLGREQSVGSVLAGSAPFADHLTRYGDRLAIGTNSRPVTQSAELLQSRAAEVAMERLASEYDPSIILVDLPPMLTGDDVMAAMGLVDCVLLIAAAGSSTIEQIDECERDLAANGNVLGVVLNKAEFSPDTYSYY